eukprot:3581261-Pyramimonas_sp.AAC.1
MQGSRWEWAVMWPLACSWLVSASTGDRRVQWGPATNSIRGTHWERAVRWPLACSWLVSAST